MSYAEDERHKQLMNVLRDIAESLRIMSGRQDNYRVEERKDTYRDKYFAKSE